MLNGDRNACSTQPGTYAQLRPDWVLNVSGFDAQRRPVYSPIMENIGFDHLPHDTRHTCISLLTEAHVDPTMIKKIVGHSGAMSLTERVYTELDIRVLVEAINSIKEKKE